MRKEKKSSLDLFEERQTVLSFLSNEKIENFEKNREIKKIGEIRKIWLDENLLDTSEDFFFLEDLNPEAF